MRVEVISTTLGISRARPRAAAACPCQAFRGSQSHAAVPRDPRRANFGFLLDESAKLARMPTLK